MMGKNLCGKSDQNPFGFGWFGWLLGEDGGPALCFVSVWLQVLGSVLFILGFFPIQQHHPKQQMNRSHNLEGFANLSTHR